MYITFKRLYVKKRILMPSNKTFSKNVFIQKHKKILKTNLNYFSLIHEELYYFDILNDFRSPKITIKQFLKCLKPYQFSISNKYFFFHQLTDNTI